MKSKNRIDWASFGYRRAFANWALRDESPEQAKIALANWDAEKLVERLAEADVENFTIDVCSQWSAHYPSKLFPVHPLLGSRDLFAELLEAAEKRGIRITAYIPIGIAGTLSNEHPDWIVRNRNNEPLLFSNTDFHRVCLNSGYRQFEIDVQREILDRYEDLAGLWYDGPGYCYDCFGDVYCYCENCRRLFRDACGRDLPTEPNWGAREWADYIHWRRRCSSDAIREIVSAVKQRRPNLPVQGNCVAQGWAGVGEEVHEHLDQLAVEMQFYDSAYILDYMKSSAGIKPLEAYLHATPRGLKSGLPEAELQYRTHFVLSHGAVPNFTWGNNDVVKRNFADMQTRLPATLNTQPMRWMGLVDSRTTRWFHNQQLHCCMQYRHENYGLHAMAQDEHLPVSITLDRHLKEEDLSEYAVLLLSDTAVIDEPTAERLRAFVDAGGGLIATQRTSLRDEHGNQRDGFLLEDLLGVRHVGGKVKPLSDPDDGIEYPLGDPEAKLETWLLSDHELFDDPIIQDARACSLTNAADPINTLITKGRVTSVEPLNDTRVLATTGEGHPLLTLRQFGKGRVAYLAANLGTSYRNQPLPWMRRLLGQLARNVASAPPPIEINAPSYCKVNFLQRGREWIVHLLSDPYPFGRWPNCFGVFRHIRQESIPMDEVILSCNTTIHDIQTIPIDANIIIRQVGPVSTIDLKQISGHMALILNT